MDETYPSAQGPASLHTRTARLLTRRDAAGLIVWSSAKASVAAFLVASVLAGAPPEHREDDRNADRRHHGEDHEQRGHVLQCCPAVRDSRHPAVTAAMPGL